MSIEDGYVCGLSYVCAPPVSLCLSPSYPLSECVFHIYVCEGEETRSLACNSFLSFWVVFFFFIFVGYVAK